MYGLFNWEIYMYGNMMKYLHTSWLVRATIHNNECEYELCYSMSASHMPRDKSEVSDSSCLF